MYMPAEQKGRIPAQSHCADERFPRWLQEKLDQRQLDSVNIARFPRIGRMTYCLEEEG